MRYKRAGGVEGGWRGGTKPKKLQCFQYVYNNTKKLLETAKYGNLMFALKAYTDKAN